MRPNREWKRIYNSDNILKYEGFALNEKPFGAGTTYYPDGTVYQEGYFDVKGLVHGKEYYPSGILRFEGSYMINYGYGPNYPVFGKCYDRSGKMYFEGELKVVRSGLGYPQIQIPKEYGPVVGEGRPEVDYLMWEDVKDKEIFEDVCLGRALMFTDTHE